MAAQGSTEIVLVWSRFAKLKAAREAFPTTACTYAKADPKGGVFRVGRASRGLRARYRGGTGYAVDAAMDGSGNSVFVAPVAQKLCVLVESELLWSYRHRLIYNNQGKLCPPSRRLNLVHRGNRPRLPRRLRS